MSKACDFPDCGREARKIGLCYGHYAQHNRGRELTPIIPRGTIRPCQVDGCTRHSHCREMCIFHYSQFQHGKAFTPAPEPKPCPVDNCRREAIAFGVCKVHSQRLKRRGSVDDRPPRFCSVDGCDRLHGAGGYCHLHYARDRFMGSPLATPSKRSAGEGSVSVHGYLVYGGRFDHPLADRKGFIKAHRAVLWDAIGPGDHPCNWCGETVSWDLSWPKDLMALVVDHLDGVKLNNDPANLVPSCGTCNRTRGCPTR